MPLCRGGHHVGDLREGDAGVLLDALGKLAHTAAEHYGQLGHEARRSALHGGNRLADVFLGDELAH